MTLDFTSTTNRKLDAITVQLADLRARVELILTRENSIMATQQQMADALVKIDAATSKAGNNIQILANVGQTVSDEIKALQASLADAGVSQALLDQAAATATKAQAMSDGLDAFVPFMQQLATDAANPVPVPVPSGP